MKRTKMKDEPKKQWFVVLSDLGYYAGLHKGGKPLWTENYDEAKPLDHPMKVQILKSFCPNKELITENI